jgi:anaphase-promoting complex subunit 10
MNGRQWASLLDDDGVDDAALEAEIQFLRENFLANTGSDPAATTGGGRGRPSDDGADADAGEAADAGEDADAAEKLLLDNPSTREPMRDLSALAVWSVSTAKPGNGVEQLLDPSHDTYWQSDGPQPHSISAQFSSKLKLSEVRLRLSFANDESYTPAIISVRVGSSFHDLRLVRRNKELSKPSGWVRIPLGRSNIAALEDWDDVSSLPSDEDDIEMMTPGELAERDQRRRVRAEHRRRKAREEEAGAGEAAASGGATGREGLARRDRTFVRAHMLQIVIHTNHQNGRDSHVRQVKLLGPAQQVAGGNAPRFSSPAFQMYETIR